MAAGAFGTPNRYNGGLGEQGLTGHWERSINMHRTSYLIVLECKESQNITWFSNSAAHSLVMIPFDSRLQALPYAVKHGWMGHRNSNTTYHANVRLNTIMDLRFDKMLPYVVEQQKKWEEKGREVLNGGLEGLDSRISQHTEEVVQLYIFITF
jgi:dipeptidase